MRFPRPRLPEIPDWASRAFTGSMLLFAVYTVVLFLVFIVWTFPHDIVVERVLEAAKNPVVAIDVSHPRFAWLSGYELQGVRFTALPLREGVPPVLEWTRLRVRPNYTDLLRGDTRSFVLSGELYGGHASGVVRMDGGTVTSRVEWSGLDLSRYRPVSGSLDAGKVSGAFSGTLALTYNGGASMQGGGTLTLSRGGLEGAKISGFVVPDLAIAEASAQLALRNDELEIQDFTATGDDVKVQASGTVQIRTPVSGSALDLRVTPHRLPANLRPLLAFLPRRGGNRDTAPFTVSGTLARPVAR